MEEPLDRVADRAVLTVIAHSGHAVALNTLPGPEARCAMWDGNAKSPEFTLMWQCGPPWNATSASCDCGSQVVRPPRPFGSSCSCQAEAQPVRGPSRVWGLAIGCGRSR